jgi:hypothetical protein
MKNVLFIITLSLISFSSLKSQNKPLLGSGKPTILKYTKSGYDKINLMDFEGNIDIKIGKPHQVTIQIDDNIAQLVTFYLDEEENELSIRIRDNKNGRLYLENINSNITITLPEASVIKHRGNSNVIVEGIVGRYFRLEQQGNGDVKLAGSIDELEITKTGNGGVFAEKLISKTANINSLGNGNVSIYADTSFSAKGAGNGNIVQFGKGKSTVFSSIIGNGRILFRTL